MMSDLANKPSVALNKSTLTLTFVLKRNTHPKTDPRISTNPQKTQLDTQESTITLVAGTLSKHWTEREI